MAELRNLDALFHNIYYNTKNAACYSSVAALYKAAKEKDPSVTYSRVKEWLGRQRTYTLQKPAIRKYPRRKTVTSGLCQQYQVDLCDMTAVASENRGFKYLFTCIDIFSKVAWAIPLRNKTAAQCALALQRVLKDGVPKSLQADDGKEFRGEFKKLLDKQGIKFFVARNPDIKCAVVERFNRTIKTRLWKYFTEHNTFKYLDVIQDLVDAYNHSYHRSIKRRPVDVNLENEGDVWQTLYGDMRLSKKDFKFNVGDKVRLAKGKSTFDKGYYEKWTDPEIFVVSSRKMADQQVYYIKDMDGVDVYGVFYAPELQLFR
jgi:hypothetical protein